MTEFLAPYHPRLVHFPIALTGVGVVFLAIGLIILNGSGNGGVRRNIFLGYGRLSLLLGWFGVLAAIVSGLVDQAQAPGDPEIVEAINQHITAGIALLVLLGLAVYWPLRRKDLFSRTGQRWGYLILLAAVAIAMLIEAWLGGKLVYQYGVGVR